MKTVAISDLCNIICIIFLITFLMRQFIVVITNFQILRNNDYIKTSSDQSTVKTFLTIHHNTANDTPLEYEFCILSLHIPKFLNQN